MFFDCLRIGLWTWSLAISSEWQYCLEEGGDGKLGCSTVPFAAWPSWVWYSVAHTEASLQRYSGVAGWWRSETVANVTYFGVLEISHILVNSKLLWVMLAYLRSCICTPVTLPQTSVGESRKHKVNSGSRDDHIRGECHIVPLHSKCEGFVMRWIGRCSSREWMRLKQLTVNWVITGSLPAAVTDSLRNN